MTVRAFRGISTVMFLRLCSRAPRTTNDSLDIDSEPTRVLASRSTLPNLLLNPRRFPTLALPHGSGRAGRADRSEEHTSELQSLRHLVCRLLLEKKKKITK